MKNHTKLGLALTLFAVSSLAVLALAIFTRYVVDGYADSEERNIAERMKSLALAGAALATPEQLNSYQSPADMERPDYRELKEKLAAFAQTMNLKYVYYLRSAGVGKIQYIIDNDYDMETQVGLATPPEVAEIENGSTEALAGQVVSSTIGYYTANWYGLLSAYAPVRDAAGEIIAAVGIDLEDTQIMASRQRTRFLTGAQIFCFVLLIVSGAICLFHFRRAERRALAASAIKSAFLARMSHEIRTPMNAIIGMSELAQREGHSPRQLGAYLAGIKNAGVNLLGIINDILDFSKIESGKMEIRPERYGTAAMLDDVLAIVGVRLAEKTLTLEERIEPTVPRELVGDAGRVRQVLTNLLSNAVKYTDQGFVKFSLDWRTVGAEEDRAELKFVVADSGIGIKEADLPRLFGDFSRVDERRNASIEGTGLGLALARRLCRAMGGDIAVTSEYGKGSTFTATITQGVGDWSRLGGYPAAGRKSSRRATTAKPRHSFTAPAARVLAVDDFAPNLLVVEGLLAPYQIETQTCASGAEAIEWLHRREFDVVFMDHMMPEMDGIEATKAIRGMGRADLPIIALTANAIVGMREMFLSNGFNDYLSKPIEVPLLDGVLRKWIPLDKQQPLVETVPVETVSVETAPVEQAPVGQAAVGTVPVGQAATPPPPPPPNLPAIAGVNVEDGLTKVGGSPALYLKILAMFCQDAQARLPLFAQTPDGEEAWKNFTIQTHALKSGLASIGADELSARAKALEFAGKERDAAAVRRQLDDFRSALTELVKNVGDGLAAPK
ncbi:MAG: response regulator [Planctomycetota bacterium]|jgi:signal transduction histidine kinase/HPt (histidine-containing phosphotransfer) domain-containing protein/ActR/RegA family two-component response regulator|nr:response regulator [Planctomycetota bacterium]